MKLTLKDPIRFTDKWVDTDGRESLSTFQGYSQFSEEDKKKAGAINNSMPVSYTHLEDRSWNGT